MRNHLSKRSRKACTALLLIAACGWVTSCKDEYRWDDEMPAELGSSIYDDLKAKGTFTTYLRLLADPAVNPSDAAESNRGLVDVLSTTGSKTVFVANDEAWAKFFANNATLPESNPWHTATCYENLSTSQKKLLIHTSMLNNAIVMENLASSEVTGDGKGYPERGQYVRRYTDVETLDSIAFLNGDALPISYEYIPANAEGKDYWAQFRTQNGGNGIYLVNDSTPSMMVHFTSEFMTNNGITDEDFSIFMQRQRNPSDVHIYDALLEQQDGICQNGYINVTEKVLYPLANMAEVIRTNGRTNIFSHMLDRWSVPFFNKGVTTAYITQTGKEDVQIYSKRYFSKNSFDGEQGKELLVDPNGLPFPFPEYVLNFDPGWNTYYDNTTTTPRALAPRKDMACMYVPTDEALWKYFTTGGGQQLIETYCTPTAEKPDLANYCDPNAQYSSFTNPTQEDYLKLFRNIDQIPLKTLNSLLNVIMFDSFIASVPSKMTKLRDDAQEQIFYPEDKQHIVDAMLASNGVIYLTDKVYGPADYTSVAAPAYISTDKEVMKWAIYNGQVESQDKMKLNYYAYLKAMQSKFIFFLPDDNGMLYYYDPVSFKSQKPRKLTFTYTGKGALPISSKLYKYNPATGDVEEKVYSGESINADEQVNRLKDILESHTIVLDGKEHIEDDVDEYYLTKNGSAVRVTREVGTDGKMHITKVQGGFQIENEEAGLVQSENLGLTHNKIKKASEMQNGDTYTIDSPIIPSAHSVWSILSNDGKEEDSPYQAFYNLCAYTRNDLLLKSGVVEEDTKKLPLTKRNAQLKKYTIFAKDDNGPDDNVVFFNNYRYTILAPTNEAIQEAIDNGLPTWEEMQTYYDETFKPNQEAEKELSKYIKEQKDAQQEVPADSLSKYEELIAKNQTDTLVMKAKANYIVNFLRYHFIDNSVFVDNSDINNAEYVTASYDNDLGLFNKVHFDRHNRILKVQDVAEHWVTIDGKYNVMARDISCNKSPTDKATMLGVVIEGSSFAVIHQIPKALSHTTGSIPSNWATPEAARRYIQRYAIH